MNTGELTYYYITNLVRAKGYNLQSLAIKKFISQTKKEKLIEDLTKDLQEFNVIYTPFLSRDIVFKNNSLVTRKSLLISPAHYFYYTKLVFDMVLESHTESVLDYKSGNITAFYSGVLFKSLKEISNSKEILFTNSYNKFQEKLLEFEGRQAIELDLSNFFDSIEIDKLIRKLYRKFSTRKVRKLEMFFRKFELKSLPQFHYSIASSILSQEYLATFDLKIENLLRNRNFEMVRFVDDMYFFNNGFTRQEKEFHEILDSINNILWQDKLNLNTNKVELHIYGNELFNRELSENLYGDSEYKVVKVIEEKSSSLTEGPFFKFIKEVNELYMNKGYHITEFTELFQKVFSVDSGEARKVLNNFVYSNKWVKLPNSELIYIVLHYQFVFYLPDIFLILYLKIYDYIEVKYGRNEETIREFLGEIDKNNDKSLKYLYSSLNYLIQRNFKRSSFLEQINEFDDDLGKFINYYIK